MHQTLARLRAARRDDRGFTLIELLIVIVILGILAAIVVFSVRGITDRGDTSACKSNITSSKVAVEAYYAQTGNYPTTAAQITEQDTTVTPVRLKLLQEAPPAGIITFGATAADEPTYKDPATC